MLRSASAKQLRDVLRQAWWWGTLSAIAVVTRTAFDWFVPPDTFYARAAASTYIAITLFLAAGFFTARRSGSLRDGVIAGLATGLISAFLGAAASLVMLGFWHDPNTLRVIEQSGGLGEVFELPLIVIIPGTVVAAVGAALATAVRSLHRPTASS